MFFFKFRFLGIIEKCVGCFLVYPFLGAFFIKKCKKKCVYVIMLKIALVLVKNMFFGLKKGISELSCWVAQKHTASLFAFKREIKHCVPNNCPCMVCKTYLPNIWFI